MLLLLLLLGVESEDLDPFEISDFFLLSPPSEIGTKQVWFFRSQQKKFVSVFCSVFFPRDSASCIFY
jgi:hypothetical protein